VGQVIPLLVDELLISRSFDEHSVVGGIVERRSERIECALQRVLAFVERDRGTEVE
jgi:hypothetical protein